ncbi:MAG: hypothetical protein KC561_01050 [Myxococcales bacterium]|nr:hypothetical protein [Myxococcales bacterium]
MKRLFRHVVPVFCCLLLGCPDESEQGGVQPGDVSDADLVGTWYQFEIVEAAEAAPYIEMYVEFLEPDPAAEYPDWYRFEMSLGEKGYYPRSFDNGYYRIDGADIVLKVQVPEVDLATQTVRLVWRDQVAPISSFTGDTFAMSGVESAFLGQPISITRYDSEGDCPLRTSDNGWVGARPFEMFGQELTGVPGRAGMVIDSRGRPYVMSTASAADGSLTIVSPRGCRWEGVALAGEVWSADFEISADDQLHVAFNNQNVFVYSSVNVDQFSDRSAWSDVTLDSGASSISRSALALDGSGSPWVLTSKNDGTSPVKLHSLSGGAWSSTELGVVANPNTGLTPIRSFNSDGSGGLHAFYGGFVENAQVTRAIEHVVVAGGVVGTPERLGGPECEVVDVVGDADGSVYAGCDRLVNAPSHAHSASLVSWNGSGWDVTRLGTGATGQLRLSETGHLLLASYPLFVYDGSDWSAEAPPGDGDSAGAAIAESPDGTLNSYQAGAGWAQRRVPRTGDVTVEVTYGGPGSGTVFSTDGERSCDASCSFLVPFGSVLWLAGEGDETSTFLGWGPTEAEPGETVVSAVQDSNSVEASFTFGRVGAAIELPTPVAATPAISDDGHIIAAYSAETPGTSVIESFAADGSSLWSTELPALVSHLSLAADGTLTVAVGDGAVRMVDSSTGDVLSTITVGDVQATFHSLQALPGGGFAVGVWFGGNATVGSETIQSGLIIYDESGGPSAILPMNNVPGRSGNGGFQHLEPFNGGLLVADSPYGTPTDPGTVIAMDLAGVEDWRLAPGGPILAMGADDEGGVWVLTTGLVDSGVSCASGNGAPGPIFLLSETGQCLASWQGFGTEDDRISGAGWVWQDTDGAATAYQAETQYSTSLPLNEEYVSGGGGLGRGAALSADGSWGVRSWVLPASSPSEQPVYGVTPVRLR